MHACFELLIKKAEIDIQSANGFSKPLQRQTVNPFEYNLVQTVRQQPFENNLIQTVRYVFKPSNRHTTSPLKIIWSKPSNRSPLQIIRSKLYGILLTLQTANRLPFEYLSLLGRSWIQGWPISAIELPPRRVSVPSWKSMLNVPCWL